MSSKEGDEEKKEVITVRRPSAQKFSLNLDNINNNIEESDDFEDDPLLQINEYIEKIEDIIINEKILLNPNKKLELNQLMKKLKTTINGVSNSSLNNIGSQSSAFSTSYFICTQKNNTKSRRKKGKNSHTPRTDHERESSRKKNEIKPIPDFVKNGYEYLSGLDESEEELKINSSQRKKEILKLIDDIDRCFAPDPIKQLSGNQVNLNKYRWTRRTHSDRDLSYVKRRAAMGGDIYDDEEDINEKRRIQKKKRKDNVK